MRTGLLNSVGLALAVLAVSCPALAHHGSLEFRAGKPAVLKEATVTNFLWINPHGFVLFDVKDAKGTVTHWRGELGSPAALRVMGWYKKSLQPGNVVTVYFYKAKFDSSVGLLDRIVFHDGTILRNSPRADGGDPSRY